MKHLDCFKSKATDFCLGGTGSNIGRITDYPD